MSAPPEPDAVDGRRLRSRQSRERILEAAIELLRKPGVDVTPELLAAHAGCSISTIARHFGDREGLADAIGERVRQELQRRMDAGPFAGDTRERARDLVHRLGTAFEATGPLLRVMHRNRLDERAARTERRLLRLARIAIARALGPELASQPGDTADILATVLSVGSWTHLRTTEALAASSAESRMLAIVLRVLDAGD